MKIIKLGSANALFKGDGYLDVPATTFVYEDGVPGIEICIELAPEEIAEISKNGKIYLYKIGTSLQPFYVSAKRRLDITEGGMNNGQTKTL